MANKDITRRQKFIFIAVMALMGLPALLIFNEGHNVWLNFIGLAYIVAVARYHRSILPSWMCDYIHDDQANQ